MPVTAQDSFSSNTFCPCVYDTADKDDASASTSFWSYDRVNHFGNYIWKLLKSSVSALRKLWLPSTTGSRLQWPIATGNTDLAVGLWLDGRKIEQNLCRTTDGAIFTEEGAITRHLHQPGTSLCCVCLSVCARMPLYPGLHHRICEHLLGRHVHWYIQLPENQLQQPIRRSFSGLDAYPTIGASGILESYSHYARCLRCHAHLSRLHERKLLPCQREAGCLEDKLPLASDD